jgi:hypothetical protein
MRTGSFALAALLTLGLPVPARAQLQLAIHDGVVSLTARDVTIRQILMEWARVGQTHIVNAEGVAGGPVSLQLVNVPEEQALDILLRAVAGYIAAPRRTVVPNTSHFDRILITPTSNPSNAPVRSAGPPPGFPQPRFDLPPDEPDVEERPDAPPPAPPLNQRVPAPVPGTFPPPVPAEAPTDEPPPAYNPAAPNVPAGVAVPGTIVQPPSQPGQPGQTPRQPGQMGDPPAPGVGDRLGASG